MLHPVGHLPAAVYWRRRVLVLTLLLSVLGGGGWVGYAVAAGRLDDGTTTAAATSAVPPAPPALERVLPPLAGVDLPAVAASTTAAASSAPAGPCTDDMIAVEVRGPASVAVGTQATFALVVTNVAAVRCVRSLDARLQELALWDTAGNRIWSSSDCLAETGTDPRTLAPGEVVSFPVEWSGLTSEPTCTASRTPPPAGPYLLQGRLDSKGSLAVPLTIT